MFYVLCRETTRQTDRQQSLSTARWGHWLMGFLLHRLRGLDRLGLGRAGFVLSILAIALRSTGTGPALANIENEGDIAADLEF